MDELRKPRQPLTGHVRSLPKPGAVSVLRRLEHLLEHWDESGKKKQKHEACVFEAGFFLKKG